MICIGKTKCTSRKGLLCHDSHNNIIRISTEIANLHLHYTQILEKICSFQVFPSFKFLSEFFVFFCFVLGRGGGGGGSKMILFQYLLLLELITNIHLKTN